MKFITEEDLRALYKVHPFTTYAPKDGERLTPGARQFLVDRGINMYAEAKKTVEAPPKVSVPDGAAAKKRLCLQMDSLRVEFFIAMKQILHTDVALAQQLTALARQLSLLGLLVDGKCTVADLYCTPCAGMDEAAFSEAQGDCVEISEFCMQLEKGDDILHLFKLRNALRLFALDVEGADVDEALRQELAKKINQIINSLSQLICAAMGGKVCQRNI